MEMQNTTEKKIELFDSINLPQVTWKKQSMHISVYADGNIVLSQGLIQNNSHISTDTKIAFCFFEDNLYFIPNIESGFDLKTNTLGTHIKHRQLVEKIKELTPKKLLPEDDQTVRYIISPEPVTLPGEILGFAVITNSCSTSNRKK